MTTLKRYDQMPDTQDPGIYTDTQDQLRHFGTMQSIADELDRPMHEIAGLYESILMQLRPQARVDDYLMVLVAKRVKAACRQH